jgi:hypothetical protein
MTNPSTDNNASHLVLCRWWRRRTSAIGDRRRDKGVVTAMRHGVVRIV